jgi:hypothetical protein
MPQLLLQGFPDGAIRIGPALSVLKKDGRVTYFVGSDNIFSHRESESGAQRYAIAMLVANEHVRPSEVERSALGIPHRTLMNWCGQLDARGADSFFGPRNRRGGAVMTAEKATECGRHLDGGATVATAARLARVHASTLRKAVKAGRVPRVPVGGVGSGPGRPAATDKSERGRADALAAEGMGTACTRADERMASALGLIACARTRFECCLDVAMGGVLTALPALTANGLFSGLERHLRLPRGFYSAMHVLTVLGYMALARIRRPEGLRHAAPGELGKVVGLDRVPEVRTLREKTALMAEQGTPQEWMEELSRQWMHADPEEAGYLYIDGHVRVYNGSGTFLPKRYVSRQKLCLRGTTDYWVNDALGRPFFVVSKAVSEGLADTLLKQIVPELLVQVPGQPSETELSADPLLHRFVVVFDREGFSGPLLSKLWEQRIGAITYRKWVKDTWPEEEFAPADVPVPGGGSTPMRLACREIVLSPRGSTIPALEVRRLTDSGHQTSIICTARRLRSVLVAGRMFSRWCQENYFAYMMQHYDIDGLVQYGSEEIPGTTPVLNPAWRSLDKAVKAGTRNLRRMQARLGAASVEDADANVQGRADLLEQIQQAEAEIDQWREQRRQTRKRVPAETLPEADRPRQLRPLAKMLTDTIKMIAYRAETAMVALLRRHLAKEDDARALVRELFVSAVDLLPDEQANTLTVRVHRMAAPVHDRAIAAVLQELTASAFQHPETGMRLIYELP